MWRSTNAPSTRTTPKPLPSAWPSRVRRSPLRASCSYCRSFCGSFAPQTSRRRGLPLAARTETLADVLVLVLLGRDGHGRHAVRRPSNGGRRGLLAAPPRCFHLAHAELQSANDRLFLPVLVFCMGCFALLVGCFGLAVDDL